MPFPRSLPEILQLYGEVLKNDIRVVLPATVTAVNPDAMQVDVQIAVNNPIFDDLGNVYSEPAPSLAGVPLAVLQGGQFLVWMPVAVGDSVLVVFSDLSCDTWVANDGTPQDPGFVGKHTADSPFAIPMVRRNSQLLAAPNADPGKIIIGKDGSPAQIRVSDTDIELGDAAITPVALATLIDSFITMLTTPPGTPPGPSEPGYAALLANIAAWKTTNWSAPSPTTGSAVAKSQ